MNKVLIISICFIFQYSCTNQITKQFQKVAAELEQPSDKYVLVVAHRGDWRNAPENSLQAIQNCIDMGVDMVEIDVRITKDKQLVVIHDKTLDRTTTGTGKVSHQTLDSLQQLQLLNGYELPTHHRIPTLEEVLLLAKNKIHVFLDKGYYVLPEVWKVVEKTGTQHQVFFEGKATYEEFQQKYPALISKIKYMPRVNPKTDNAKQYLEAYTSKINAPLLIATFSEDNRVFFNLLKMLNAKGIGIMGATLWDQSCGGHTDDVSVDNPEDGWGWMIGQGFTAICTDRPALLISYLRQKKLH